MSIIIKDQGFISKGFCVGLTSSVLFLTGTLCTVPHWLLIGQLVQLYTVYTVQLGSVLINLSEGGGWHMYKKLY